MDGVQTTSEHWLQFSLASTTLAVRSHEIAFIASIEDLLQQNSSDAIATLTYAGREFEAYTLNEKLEITSSSDRSRFCIGIASMHQAPYVLIVDTVKQLRLTSKQIPVSIPRVMRTETTPIEAVVDVDHSPVLLTQAKALADYFLRPIAKGQLNG